MDTGGLMISYILRFLSWILIAISAVLIVLIGMRAFGYQDLPTYTQDIFGIVICMVLAFICWQISKKFGPSVT
jgi:hypothetical protein